MTNFETIPLTISMDLVTSQDTEDTQIIIHVNESFEPKFVMAPISVRSDGIKGTQRAGSCEDKKNEFEFEFAQLLKFFHRKYWINFQQ